MVSLFSEIWQMGNFCQLGCNTYSQIFSSLMAPFKYADSSASGSCWWCWLFTTLRGIYCTAHKEGWLCLQASCGAVHQREGCPWLALFTLRASLFVSCCRLILFKTLRLALPSPHLSATADIDGWDQITFILNDWSVSVVSHRTSLN